jgi:hydroxymethylpyrimidine/phosphomethylpyrimidine kinase
MQLTGVLNDVKTITQFQGSSFVLSTDVYATNGQAVSQIYNDAAGKVSSHNP